MLPALNWPGVANPGEFPICTTLALGFVLGLRHALAAQRVRLLERSIRLAAGLFSLGFGLFLVQEVGLIQPLIGRGA